MTSFLPAALAIAATLLAAFEQARPAGTPEPPPLDKGTSSIHGRVIDALTGKPIEGAEVRLFADTIEQEKRAIRRGISTRSFARLGKTLTASDGSYAFDGIRAGAYRLFAMHRMYLFPCQGPADPRCLIAVATDQRLDAANVSLAPGAIIRGRVLDKEGRPVEGARVRTEFDQPLANLGGNATSGADGRFEITSASPGQMLVLVDPLSARGSWHRTVYYPGVHARDEALPVTAEVGATVEIEIRERELPVATIRTTLSGPEGFHVQRVTLVNPDTRMLVNMKVSDEGVASATELDEGMYVISATAIAGSDTLAAYQTISVGAGEYDVPMLLEPTATVFGRVVIDGGGLAPVDGVFVEAHWGNANLKLDLAGPERISVAPDGSFTLRGLYGRRQFQLFGLPDEWHVTAVRAGRVDVTRGVDLTPGSTTEISIVVARR